VFVDVNVRPAAIRDPSAYRARLGRILGRADVVKASVDDLAWLTPRTEPDAAATALLAGGAAAVLVTDGGNPVRLVGRDEIEMMAVPAVAVVDTVGAGDAFGAGFLAAWHAGSRRRADLSDRATMRAATQLAIRVGAASTTRPGAEPPSRADVDAIRPA
jgi:fructokinase